ncbi:MAG: acylphosphatase [Desulfobacterales bacterium]
MNTNVRAHAIISGRVQGVFFRMETCHAAERYGVFGWVRNRRDGTVEALFEGDKNGVESILQWCKKGPPHSEVKDIKVSWDTYLGEFTKFKIRY